MLGWLGWLWLVVELLDGWLEGGNALVQSTLDNDGDSNVKLVHGEVGESDVEIQMRNEIQTDEIFISTGLNICGGSI